MQRAAYAVVRCLSVRPSVMFLNSVKTNKHASIFFTIGSYTFHYVSFIPAPVGCVLRLFSAVTPADVVASVKALPDKQCASYPLPTWLLKKCVGVISPFLCQLFNWSLEHGSVPLSFKCAYITRFYAAAEESRSRSGRR